MTKSIFENMDNGLTFSEWVPVDSSFFKNKINKNLFSTVLGFDNKIIKVNSDEIKLIEKVENFYDTKIEGDKSSELYFLTQEKSFDIENVIKYKFNRGTIDFTKCTAFYDLNKNSLFIYAFDNFGFLKSLVLGVLGIIQEENDLYALHAGVVKEDEIVRAYVGQTEAGKTTHSLIGSKKKNYTYLTDDWSVWNNSGFAEIVDKNLMIKDDKKIKEDKGDKKKMFRARDILDNDKIKEKLKVDCGVLLLPKKLEKDVYEISDREFTKYVIRSTYHLPFNYFFSDNLSLYDSIWNHDFDDVIKKKQEKREIFWGNMYDRLDLVFAVSTRNKEPIKTHKIIDKYVSRKI